jgi:DNA adenine methylase
LALSEAPQRQPIRFTPLRYPGGKAKLAPYVKRILHENRLLDGEYVEPYAGGAGIALELLLQEYVSRIHINDISKPIYAFWNSVLRRTEELCRLVSATPLTVSQWDRQKRIIGDQRCHDDVSLGFATFFLNRTNRSGILNGGIIGGRRQKGPWKIDARYNPKELIRRITAIAKVGGRINLTRQDALDFLRDGITRWPKETLIYLDPPYYVKGRDLYYDFYEPKDHEAIAKFVSRTSIQQRWIVSYDNVRPILNLYAGTPRITYKVGYSARSAALGSEVMFFSGSLTVPKSAGTVRGMRSACTNRHL